MQRQAVPELQSPLIFSSEDVIEDDGKSVKEIQNSAKKSFK